MEQLKQVVHQELGLVGVDVFTMDDTQRSNVEELIREKIEEEMVELESGDNDYEFILGSVLPALTLYYDALFQMKNPMIRLEHVRTDYSDAGNVLIYYRNDMISLTSGEIGEHLGTKGDQAMCVWIGDAKLYLDAENLNEIIEHIFEAEEEHQDKEFDNAQKILALADELEEQPMPVEKFMQDYALWVGQCLIAPQPQPDYLTPYKYIEEFVSMAWLPQREEMFNFLTQFYPANSVNSFIHDTFVWE